MKIAKALRGLKRTDLNLPARLLCIASILLAMTGEKPADANEENIDGVTVKRNADGSVDVYDTTDSGKSSSSSATSAPGARTTHYVPGKDPYVKRYADGTVVKRNPDGSIETYDAGETVHWGSESGTAPSAPLRALPKKKSPVASSRKTSKTPAKVTSSQAVATPKKQVIMRRGADGTLQAVPSGK